LKGSSSTSKYTGFGQALSAIVREEGIQGLWRGTLPGLLLQVPYTAVQFVVYQHCMETANKLGFRGPDGRSASPFVSFGSGAVAGVCGTVASYPFDLLRTTLAAQGEPKVYSNMFDAARGIVKTSGFWGLYRGLGVTVVEIIPGAALQFGLYDLFKSSWKKMKQKHLLEDGPKDTGNQGWVDGWANFTCGFLAGLLAKLATHPLDVAKKRYQVAGLQRSLNYGARVDTSFVLNSLAKSLVGIYRAEGFAGLWKGSLPSIIKAAPNSAVSFMVYDMIRGALLQVASPHPDLLPPLLSTPLKPKDSQGQKTTGKG
jgi:solute carrier family 25 thiamine pyrophosphate transporter 19